MSVPRLAIGVILSACSASAGAQERPPIADPHAAFLVEGRVVHADGRAAAGVQIERADSETGARPYSEGLAPLTTGADGGFRFHFSGLGMGAGTTWHLAVRRPGCPTTVSTVTLARGPMPPPDDAWEGDIRTRIVIRLAPCAANAPTVPLAQPRAAVAVRWAGPRPARARLYVVWIDERASPPFEFVPLAEAGAGRAHLPTTAPERMRARGDGILVGYFMAFRDLDGDGRPTVERGKIWRWREFAGAVNQHVLFLARTATTGRRAPGLATGMHVRRVTLTAQCSGDSCRGHDATTELTSAPHVLLFHPRASGAGRLPNVD